MEIRRQVWDLVILCRADCLEVDEEGFHRAAIDYLPPPNFMFLITGRRCNGMGVVAGVLANVGAEYLLEIFHMGVSS